jgi:hypothetical protein
VSSSDQPGGARTGSASDVSADVERLDSCFVDRVLCDNDPVIRQGVLAANSSIPAGGPADADCGSADICSDIAG